MLQKRPSGTTENPYSAKVSSVELEPPNFFFQTTLGSKRAAVTNDAPVKKPPPGYMCKRCHSESHFLRECPYKDSGLAERPQYICHICHEPGHKIQNCPNKSESGSLNKSVPSACWFCLSNPELKRHLIVDIWEEFYLTLAKGGLNSQHLILIPVEHLPANSLISHVTRLELDSHLNNINKVFAQKSEVLVIFCLKQNPLHHLHYQVISIPAESVSKFEDFLLSFSQRKNHILEPFTKDMQEPETFFELTLLSGDGRKSWHHQIESKAYFPANFGRELMAEFLGLTDRLDWRLSPLSESEEILIVNEWKKALKK